MYTGAPPKLLYLPEVSWRPYPLKWLVTALVAGVSRVGFLAVEDNVLHHRNVLDGVSRTAARVC